MIHLKTLTKLCVFAAAALGASAPAAEKTLIDYFLPIPIRSALVSNVSIMVRPDGDFMIVPRSGAILISKNGILLTSADGVKWDSLGKVNLKSDRTIDPCVMQVPGGGWRMWYKDERAKRTLCYADSPDLLNWEAKGTAVTNYNGEGPKAFHWKGKYWLIADCWRNGMRVWNSEDCLNWTMQDQTLLGSHGDVVVSGDRAWWFYFTEHGRRAAIDLVELTVADGKLIPGDPNQPTFIDLKPERELEK